MFCTSTSDVRQLNYREDEWTDSEGEEGLCGVHYAKEGSEGERRERMVEVDPRGSSRAKRPQRYYVARGRFDFHRLDL
jgi:hypothetical protein